MTSLLIKVNFIIRDASNSILFRFYDSCRPYSPPGEGTKVSVQWPAVVDGSVNIALSYLLLLNSVVKLISGC